MTIQLNNTGVRHAKSLIAAGKVDKDSAWSFDAADGNALLGPNGDDWTAYSQAHIGEDPGEADNTKAHWRYPVVKDGKVYRRGVIAAKSRAAQQGDGLVEDAAAKLLNQIDGVKDSPDMKSRLPAGLEIRAAAEFRSDAEKGIIEGYAAVFNSPTVIGDWFSEQVAPGAFGNSIRSDDIRALFNHDDNFVLGRTANGTLKLSEDSRGLQFEVTTPPTTWARDLVASVDRGDVNQCSFSFTPQVEEWDETGNIPKRTLRQVKLWDVSPVTFPAYDDTACAARSRAAAKGEVIVPARVSPAELARVAMRRAHLDRLIRA